MKEKIADIYATNEDDLIKLTFADPGERISEAVDMLTDEEFSIVGFADRESTADVLDLEALHATIQLLLAVWLHRV